MVLYIVESPIIIGGMKTEKKLILTAHCKFSVQLYSVMLQGPYSSYVFLEYISTFEYYKRT